MIHIQKAALLYKTGVWKEVYTLEPLTTTYAINIYHLQKFLSALFIINFSQEIFC